MVIRTKVCGITTISNALDVANAGVDAIGLVFYKKSPRYVSVEKAAAIIAALPPFVTTVGLFLDAPQSEVEIVLKQVPLDVLQFHGQEKSHYCDSFSRPYIKAIGMKGLADFEKSIATYQQAQGFLLDSHVMGEAGGTGEVFDWDHIPHTQVPIILAGGLNPDNIANALTQAQQAHKSLYAVDVSSGVESAPGIKNSIKVKHFISAVKRFNA